MIPEHLVFFSLPILLSFLAAPILIKSKTFIKLEPLEKFIFSLALSSVIIILFLTFYAIFIPVGFRAISQVLFILAVLIIFWTGFSYRRNITPYLRLGLLEIKKAISNPIRLLFLVVFFTYLIKALLFLFYKPIIDPDVVDSYLPFARSLFLAGNLPLKDFFSNRPIMIPPVGGFILYAWNYALTGSILSEAFRLIPLPFLLGDIFLVYLIGKKTFGKKIGLLSSIVFAFLPFQDESLFLTVYYPDCIFLFFCLFILYLLIEVFGKAEKKLSNNIYLYLIGLSIAIAFLLKLQVIFLYLFFILIFIKELENLIVPLKRIIGTLFIVGFFIAPFFSPWLRVYGKPPFWWSIFLIGTIILFYLWYLERKGASNKKFTGITFKSFIGVLLISSIGGIWFLRNLIIFHHPTADFSTETSRTLVRIFYNISQSVDKLSGVVSLTKTITWSKDPLLSIFYWPILGTFWIVPKFWGLFSVLKRRKGFILLFWGLGWFCYWQIYLGGLGGNRYLLPLIPVLTWAIAVGVEELSRRFKAAFLKKKKVAVDVIIVLMVVFGLLFSLIQSSFLWWNAGIIYYGQTELRNQALEVVSPQTVEKLNVFDESLKLPPTSYKENLVILAKKLVVAFSASSDLARGYTKELVLAGILGSLVVFLFLLALPKVRLAARKLSKAILILGVVLILPYLLVFMLISEGNLNQFAKFEREKVYSSWGQAKFIEPFLIENAQKNDKVLFYGMQTGLSYYTGLKVYNLEYDIAWVGLIQAIIYETNKEKVISFLKGKDIRYIVVDTHGKSAKRFAQFKDSIGFLSILDDSQYVEQMVFPTKENAWTLYEIK